MQIPPSFPGWQSPINPPPGAPDPDPTALATLEPLPALLKQLPSEFDRSGTVRLSRAPARLDVMGGIAAETGSIVCHWPLACGAAVALQARIDRQIKIFFVNARKSITTTLGELIPPIETNPTSAMARCFGILHESGLLDLRDLSLRGVNVALLSSIPEKAGLASTAAITVAALVNLIDHYNLRSKIDAPGVAQLSHTAVGGGPGLVDHMTVCAAQSGSLVRILCQPDQLLPPLTVPMGLQILAIDTGVPATHNDVSYKKSLVAASMAHQIILCKMREIGQAAQRPLIADPTGGYLANLNPDDYKTLFRPHLPEFQTGREFVARFAPTLSVDADETYPVQHAADHHILEARRVQQFIAFLEKSAMADIPFRKKLLAKAGHLMFASHLSYSIDAMLGDPAADVLVGLVRARQSAGLHGARITARGAGGTIAVLADDTFDAFSAISQILSDYQLQTGNRPQLFRSSSGGAWAGGAKILKLES